jgi:hypothetical protein
MFRSQGRSIGGRGDMTVNTERRQLLSGAGMGAALALAGGS